MGDPSERRIFLADDRRAHNRGSGPGASRKRQVRDTRGTPGIAVYDKVLI